MTDYKIIQKILRFQKIPKDENIFKRFQQIKKIPKDSKELITKEFFARKKPAKAQEANKSSPSPS